MSKYAGLTGGVISNFVYLTVFVHAFETVQPPPNGSIGLIPGKRTSCILLAGYNV
jgi:hypothetical protein